MCPHDYVTSLVVVAAVAKLRLVGWLRGLAELAIGAGRAANQRVRSCRMRSNSAPPEHFERRDELDLAVFGFHSNFHTHKCTPHILGGIGQISNKSIGSCLPWPGMHAGS